LRATKKSPSTRTGSLTCPHPGVRRDLALLRYSMIRGRVDCEIEGKMLCGQGTFLPDSNRAQTHDDPKCHDHP
jgi:hypothetical protein